MRLSTAAGLATLEVEDDGIGIAAEDLPFIFDRFYRADPSRSLVEGSGLGLSIARWIADTHEAKLTVQSEPQLGTVCQLAFPCIEPA
jgi:signal transduction histidine kinase